MRINVNWLNHIGNFAYIVSFFKFYCLYISIILKSFLNQFASISIVSGHCFHFIFIFIFRRCLLLSFVQFPSLLLQQKANCVFLSLFLFIVRYYCTQSKTLSPVQLGIYVKWNLQWNIKWEMVASIVYSNRLQIELLRSYFHSFVTSVFAIVPLYTVCVCVCLSLSLLESQAKRTDDFHFKQLDGIKKQNTIAFLYQLTFCCWRCCCCCLCKSLFRFERLFLLIFIFHRAQDSFWGKRML